MLRQARAIVPFAIRDPLVVADYVKWRRDGRDADADISSPPRMDALPLDAGLEVVRRTLGSWTPGPALDAVTGRELATEAKWGGGALMGGDPSLGQLAYGVVRAVAPETVIETGVATGVTSAHVLAALADNGTGTLHSIDLPPTDMLDKGTVGAAVPDELRDRWRYRVGSAKRLLPRALAATGGRRVFIHDSDHSYNHMTWELDTAWSAFGTGDVLLCDDVHYHSAFADMAARVGVTPLYVDQSEKSGTTGMLVVG